MPDHAPGRRGGKRPGAGAPIGNRNRLTHGRRSKQLRSLAAAIQALPITAGVLERFDTAGKRELLARALFCFADLLLLEAPDGQSNNPFYIERMQVQILRDLVRSNAQSNRRLPRDALPRHNR